LRHLPEYGIPDINAVFQQLPDSVYMLTQAIRLAIERYEPRLKNIEVYTKQDDRDDTVIQCIIQAALCNEVAIQYLTFFLGSRQVKVEI
jgi:type VI secretion system protein